MQITSQEDIELACTAFEKRVHTLIEIYSDRNPYFDELSIAIKKAKQCIRHANHVLCTLSNKLRSLNHALTAFRDVSANDYMRAFSSSLNNSNNNNNKQYQERLLHQWFANYLRIRDGFLLFESGERRHKHDVTNKTYGEFPSLLSTKPKYDDNTQTFSSELGYTGYGMDEFNDEVVGIRKRLLDQLVIIKGGVRGDNTRGMRDKIWNKILDDPNGSSGEIWNLYFENIVTGTDSLRKDLLTVQSRFVADINQLVQTHWRQHHNRTNTLLGKIVKLKLITEDKAERISFGSGLDVCRDGNNFTLADKGGSLPIGMSVGDWKRKFRPPTTLQQQQQQSSSSSSLQQRQQQQQANQKRRRIMESSDEESDDDDDNNGVNGLVVREHREESEGGAQGNNNNQKTSSLDEIKRQAGVSSTQLEQGFDQLEGEEFKSTMAANEDDVKEGFLADFGGNSSTTAGEEKERKCPHLVSAVTQFQLLRKNVDYQNRYLCDHNAENLWADFLVLATEQWKEAVNLLLRVRKDISSGVLQKTSDEAYEAREQCREVNMFLGIHCLDIHDFLSEEVSKLSGTNGISSTISSLSPFHALLSQTDHCFLLAAEEAFKNALILVMEQEECHKSLPDDITNRWVKGQHFLLRGRAQQNVGQALLEQSQCEFLVSEGGNWKVKRQRLLKRASREFADSLNSANLCRGNTTAIYGHSDAGLIGDGTDCTWSSSAMRQSFEALKLVSLTSRYYGDCFWKLGEMEKAKNTFCGTADLSEYLNFLGEEHISSEEVVDALSDPYWCAVTLVELARVALEEMPIRGGNEKKGNDILRMVKLSLQQARLVSDKIFDLAREHSIENVNKDISTRGNIDKEEKNICDMWEQRKALAKKNVSQPQSSLQNDALTAFPRGDIGELARKSAMAAGARRRIFVQGAGASSSSLRRRRARKKGKQIEEERQAASERFNDAFGNEDETSNFNDAASGLDPTQPSSQQREKYLKWGDELLEEHERNAYPACCPPLPPNMEPNIKMAITAKLGGILPSDDTLVAKLYTCNE